MQCFFAEQNRCANRTPATATLQIIAARGAPSGSQLSAVQACSQQRPMMLPFSTGSFDFLHVVNGTDGRTAFVNFIDPVFAGVLARAGHLLESAWSTCMTSGRSCCSPAFVRTSVSSKCHLQFQGFRHMLQEYSFQGNVSMSEVHGLQASPREDHGNSVADEACSIVRLSKHIGLAKIITTTPASR